MKLVPTTPDPKAATSEATAGTPDTKAAEAPATPAATTFLVPGGCCSTCGQRAPPTNPLVATGLVSQDLANVLVPPVFQTSNRQKVKRRLLLPARVITSVKYNKLLHQQEAGVKEKQERKRKREELQRRREKREPGKNTKVKRKWQAEVSEHCTPVSEDDVCLQPQLPWAFSFPSFDSLL